MQQTIQAVIWFDGVIKIRNALVSQGNKMKNI